MAWMSLSQPIQLAAGYTTSSPLPSNCCRKLYAVGPLIQTTVDMAFKYVWCRFQTCSDTSQTHSDTGSNWNLHVHTLLWGQSSSYDNNCYIIFCTTKVLPILFVLPHTQSTPSTSTLHKKHGRTWKVSCLLQHSEGTVTEVERQHS